MVSVHADLEQRRKKEMKRVTAKYRIRANLQHIQMQTSTIKEINQFSLSQPGIVFPLIYGASLDLNRTKLSTLLNVTTPLHISVSNQRTVAMLINKTNKTWRLPLASQRYEGDQVHGPGSLQ